MASSTNEEEIEAIEIESSKPTATVSHPLVAQAVPIDEHCTGVRWSAEDEDRLARLVAIIAMGQAAYAGYLLKELLPAAAAFTDEDLRREAKIRLSVQERRRELRAGYPRWQRDGFIFEAISWIAARQTLGERILLKDPHVSATSQGLDGLMIELAPDKKRIVMTTVFEDKCTDNPRDTFTQQVIPAFLHRHQNRRSVELVASASVLLRMASLDEAAAAQLAAAVMNREQRTYRAAFALTSDHDSQGGRRKLFKGYDVLDGIPPTRRIGASLIVSGKLREWFDTLAFNAIAYLDSLEVEEA